MPARYVAVPDQKYAIAAIQHEAADAERHPSGKPPVQMEDAAQRGLGFPAQGLQIHGGETSMLAKPACQNARAFYKVVVMAFTLAHLSDPHLPPLPVPTWRELAGKRAFGWLNWTRNRD